MTNEHTLTPAPEDHGLRLDKFLARHLPALSRSRLQALILQGQVACGAEKADDAARKVRAGETWRVTVPPVESSPMEAQAMALEIVYEDEDVLVLNKPAGLTVHPAPGHPDKTLVNALLAHCGGSLSGIGGVARPGIVHRIDKDTSGLMAVAKHDAAHASLSEQLQSRTMKRVYLALAWGTPKPPQGTIKAPIGRNPKNRKKMAVVKKGGKAAITHYKLLPLEGGGLRRGSIFRSSKDPHPTLPLAGGGISLVECRLETGRTHQIRVHMAHIGHPLVGDPAYGATTKSKLAAKDAKSLSDEARAALLRFNRQALHAKSLAFVHPASGEAMEFSSEMPDDMRALIAALQ
jgi:23S rRNA pseudouridine1911/1915/1917 synthase